MRIALISPYSIGTMRGNITTVRRLNRFLNKIHIETLVLAADTLSIEEMAQRLITFSPTLIHGFHARYCGELSAVLAHRFHTPFIITITGSDLGNPALRDHPSTIGSLAQASAIVCFCQSAAAELAARFPGVSDRISVIPQGVEALPDGGLPDYGIPEEAFVILLPAGLRPVKNIECASEAIKALWKIDNRFRLVISGGEIERAYADGIRLMAAAAPWVSWLGEVPYEQMGALYRRADLVLNCSHYEGMSNSLMEAMALGRPVVASDIPGNRSLVEHGGTGWLFAGATDLRDLVASVAGDELRRVEIGQRARKNIEKNFSPYAEAENHRDLYHAVISKVYR